MENKVKSSEAEIKELQQQLMELKVKNQWEKLQEELEKAKETYLNKYYGSHTFRFARIKMYKTNILSLNTVDKVYIGRTYSDEVIETFDQFLRYDPQIRLDFRIVCEGESKRISKSADSIHISSSRFKSGLRNAIQGFNVEVHKEVYDNIDALINESIDLVLSTPLNVHEYSQGCSSQEADLLKEYGENLIELTHEECYSLDWHPFIYENMLLVNELSRRLIEDRIKEETELDLEDVDYFFQGERIRRIGNHGRTAERLSNVLSRFPIQKS